MSLALHFVSCTRKDLIRSKYNLEMQNHLSVYHKKTVGWECMYITMGTAVYGYISYEFLGLFEVL